MTTLPRQFRGSADIRVQHLKLKRGDKCPKYISQWFITKHLSLNAFNLWRNTYIF